MSQGLLPVAEGCVHGAAKTVTTQACDARRTGLLSGGGHPRLLDPGEAGNRGAGPQQLFSPPPRYEQPKCDDRARAHPARARDLYKGRQLQGEYRPPQLAGTGRHGRVSQGQWGGVCPLWAQPVVDPSPRGLGVGGRGRPTGAAQAASQATVTWLQCAKSHQAGDGT